jgi:uncharacterized protein YndB with AHSA1/START domain
MSGQEQLQYKQIIRAPRERVFAAWTKPELLVKWWGPGEVTCPEAHVDLKPGGEYRLSNLQPDGATIWISGTFQEVSPPTKLVYDWNVAAMGVSATLVTVMFNEHPEGTEIVLIHEHFDNAATRNMHLEGWGKCIEKLALAVAQ